MAGDRGDALRLDIEGMTCPLCEDRVARALAAVPGVAKARADFTRGRALVTPAGPPADDLLPLLAASLERAGYRLAGSGPRPLVPDWARSLGILIAVAALFCLLRRFVPAGLTGFFPEPGGAASLGALFVVGLLTSPHCLAMCGGLVMTQSLWAAQHAGTAPIAGTAEPRGGIRRAVLCYQLGRLLAYSAVGAAAGALGRVFALTPALRGALMLLAGAFMLLMALNMLGGFRFLRRCQIRPPRPLRRLAAVLRDRPLANGAGGGGRLLTASLGMGLANGLMPCGPLQVMQIYALGAGGAGAGAAAMAAFCLGAMPALLGLGLFTGRLNGRAQKNAGPVFQASAALVMVLALGMMQNGLALRGVGTVFAPAARVPASGGAPRGAVARLTETGQEVRSGLDFDAYEPIVVQRGLPVTWTLHAPEDRLVGCNNEIVAPGLGIERKLAAGDNVITFTPERSGVYPFTCWMGMITSRITVVDSLP